MITRLPARVEQQVSPDERAAAEAVVDVDRGARDVEHDVALNERLARLELAKGRALYTV